jgi:hypothetical protein
MATDPPKPRFIEDGKVQFHFQKTPHYRGIHADGFWGGPTPRGGFAVSFFSERQPIPRHAHRETIAGKDGAFDLGPELVTDVLPGIVRQVEATVYMDLKAVQELYVWMGINLSALEKALGVPEEERVAKGEG